MPLDAPTPDAPSAPSTATTASIAAACSATAASASGHEPDAVISRAGPLVHSGSSAGTSIMPAPCAVDIAHDQSASAARGSLDATRCGAPP